MKGTAKSMVQVGIIIAIPSGHTCFSTLRRHLTNYFVCISSCELCVCRGDPMSEWCVFLHSPSNRPWQYYGESHVFVRQAL